MSDLSRADVDLDIKIRQALVFIHSQEVPDWLYDLDPNWLPGKLLSLDAVKKLFLSDDLLEQYQLYCQDILAPLGNLIMQRLHGQKVPRFTHDSAEMRKEIMSNIATLGRLQNQRNTGSIPKKTLEVPDVIYSKAELFTYSSDPKRMCAKIRQFIGSQFAKGKTTQRKPNTIRAYIQVLWENGTEFTLLSFLQENWGQEAHFGSLMFRKDFDPIVLDEQFDNFVLGHRDSDPEGPHPSTRSHMLNAVVAVLDYLKAAAIRVKFDKETETAQINERTIYLANLITTRDRLKTHFGGLHKKARESSVFTQHRQELMEPGSREAKGNAFDVYYRGNHYNNTLLQLMKLAEAVGVAVETGAALEEPIQPAEFVRLGHFLMIMLTLSNGNRKSDPEKMRLQHAKERREIQWADTFDKVKFIRHSFLRSDHYQYLIGADNARNGVNNFEFFKASLQKKIKYQDGLISKFFSSHLKQ